MHVVVISKVVGLAPQVVRSFVDIQITERQNVDNQIVDRK
jgi:hypothetical protein